MISSLLHLVGLRPRVYYTLTNFRGGGGQGPLGPHPQYANAMLSSLPNYYYMIFLVLRSSFSRIISEWCTV